MASATAATPARSALVLGGGGVTGIAWETGILAGLSDRGIDLTTADIIVGTSAGAVVGAQVASGRPVRELYEAQLREPTGEISARLGLLGLARWILAAVLPGGDQASRARLGRWALRARTVPESERREVIESRLGDPAWPPTRRLLITAVDAENGDLAIFDRDSGVRLVDAVGASCAVPLVWPPLTINGRRYVDGGVRSALNADLAAGAERLVAIAPITTALRRSGRVAVQLRALGPELRSVVIAPDEAARKAIGRNLLDPSRRVGAARAGYAQAAKIAPQVAAVWSA